MSNHRTRIEIRLKGKKRPIEFVTQIQALLDRVVNDQYNPFDRVFVNHISFKPIDSLRNPNDAYKLGSLTTLSELESFQIARRRLNKNKNFNRDFAHLFERSDEPIELGELFKQSIITHFNDLGE